jgi:biopolymer transport protein ExbD
MPVHAAGSRLYSGVKFRHLVKRHGSASARGSNISLNLVPFVDMMTILVCFLLMVFSATNVLTKTQKGLELPIAATKSKLQGAPIIMITKGEITVFHGRNGTPITTVETVLRDETPAARIERLFEVLESIAKEIKADVLAGTVPADSQADLSPKDMAKACDLVKAGQRPARGEPQCPDGLAILQADETTDVRVINKIVNTAKQSGFDNLMFAIKNK